MGRALITYFDRSARVKFCSCRKRAIEVHGLLCENDLGRGLAARLGQPLIFIGLIPAANLDQGIVRSVEGTPGNQAFLAG